MSILRSINDINSIVQYIESKTIEDIIIDLSNLYNMKTEEVINCPMGLYSKEKTQANYYLVISDIKNNIYKYEWLYHRLGDIESKNALLNLLRYRIVANIEFLTEIHNENNDKNFENNIINCEVNAIIESQDYIKNDFPKLAINIDNIVSDIWEIPLVIDSINDNYEFYIRTNKQTNFFESVLYTLPKDTKTNHEKNKGLYMIPYIDDYITNVRLTKDVCLIPYFMHKLRGYNSVIVSEKEEERPYLDKYLKGLKIEVTNSKLPFYDGILNYIATNYKKMDVLMLFGAYHTYFDKLDFYRKLRPDGKVYLKLDANSGWMDYMNFEDYKLKTFLEKVDVISVESKAMKKYLSTKIPYKKIEYIPNGYYDYLKCEEVKYEEKENNIITVGRIGTKEKNNETLLEAFKLVAEEIPNWNLKLIGEIEPSFYEYIENYFIENPNLKNRVIFTGNIESKEELFNEYRKSKIFVLTSPKEGGSPNVYSEAALNGNYIITSNIDAAIDMTDNQNIGDIFNLNDTMELSSILLKRCKDEKYIESKCSYIQNYIKTYFNYEKTVLKIDYLLNM